MIQYSGIRRMVALAAGMNDVISLAIGEPDYDTPQNIKKAAIKALEDGFTHYTQTQGLKEFRDAVSEKLRRENSLDYDPVSEIVATVGATEACFSSILSIVNPGDEVIITDPGFVFYAPTIILAGGTPVYVPIEQKRDFVPSAELLEEHVTEHTKAIWINSPHNPTGAVLSKDDLIGVSDIAKRHDLLVVSDEVYEKFVFDGNEHFSIGALPDMKERTITINALSKTYAMTGLRLGYVAAPKNLIDRIHLVHMHVCTHPSSEVQKAGVEALLGPQDSVREMVAEFVRRRELMIRRLNEIEGFSCWPVRGSFYAFPDVSDFHMPSFEFAEQILKEAKVNTVPGAAFGKNGEGFLRISFAAKRETIETGMDRLESFAKKLRQMGRVE
jgi:aminotransferase